MGEVRGDGRENWSRGLVAQSKTDLQDPSSFPRGRNTILVNASPGIAVVGSRAGFSLQNPIAIAAEPAIVGQIGFRRRTSPTTNAYQHMLVDSAGGLSVLDRVAGTIAPADAGIPTPFTTGILSPSLSIMNNLLFIANGVDEVHVFNGTDVWDHGFANPPVAVDVESGAGDMPPGEYDVALTWYDSVTGLESSRSVFSTITLLAGGGSTLTVSWTAFAGDHPHTHTRVYIRQTSNQSEFFLAATVAAGILTADISLTQDQLDALTILAPGPTENNPLPSSGILSIEPHASRLFAHDGGEIFFSNLNQPEAFNSQNAFKINADDGNEITALHSAHELLLMFKHDALWILVGEDPKSWSQKLIEPEVGCIASNSIVTVEGVTYWWSVHGPMAWDGMGKVQPLGLGVIDEILGPEYVSFVSARPDVNDEYVGVVATADPTNQRILWAFPFNGSETNNRILTYKYRLGAWETSGWETIDAASLAQCDCQTEVPRVYLGSYGGQVFRYGSTFIDGIPGGDTHGDVVSATATTLTVDGTLHTTDHDLSERYVVISGPDNGDQQRKRIASNSATVITLATGETFDPVPTIDWTWSVGEILFEVELPWSPHANAFQKKRYEYLYGWVGSSVREGTYEVQIHRDYNDASAIRTYQLTTSADGLVWDEGNWDESFWGGSLERSRFRKRIAKTGWAYRMTLRSTTPGQDFILYRTDCRAEMLTDKAGG